MVGVAIVKIRARALLDQQRAPEKRCRPDSARQIDDCLRGAQWCTLFERRIVGVPH